VIGVEVRGDLGVLYLRVQFL